MDKFVECYGCGAQGPRTPPPEGWALVKRTAGLVMICDGCQERIEKGEKVADLNDEAEEAS
ncbi:MAG TPA: hypothetical protein VF192_01170 [Longimicrobiales bacterium]